MGAHRTPCEETALLKTMLKKCKGPKGSEEHEGNSFPMNNKVSARLGDDTVPEADGQNVPGRLQGDS